MSDLGFTAVAMTAERIARTSPFGEAAYTVIDVDLDKEIDVTQFADELGTAAGFPVMVAMITPFDDIVAKLYVTPPVAEDVIVEALRVHQIDDLYGLDESQRQRRELMIKLVSGQALNDEELRNALKLALASA